jgi:hypothetical protein
MGEIAVLAADDVLELRTGTIEQGNRRPCIVIVAKAASGLPAVLEILIGRRGWELWPISSPRDIGSTRIRLLTALASHQRLPDSP